MTVKVNKADIKSVMCPAVNGVRSEAQAVRIHNGSTWVDVWNSITYMSLISNSITKGMLSINSADAIQFSKTAGGSMSTMAGGGTLVFSAEGEWVNPTITFNYEGGLLYEVSSGTYATTTAGSISLYHRVKGSSSASTTAVVPKVGTDAINNFYLDVGTVNKTLSGTYDRLGLSITIPAYNGSYTFASLSLSINTVAVGTKKLGFKRSDTFDYY